MKINEIVLKIIGIVILLSVVIVIIYIPFVHNLISNSVFNYNKIKKYIFGNLTLLYLVYNRIPSVNNKYFFLESKFQKSSQYYEIFHMILTTKELIPNRNKNHCKVLNLDYNMNIILFKKFSILGKFNIKVSLYKKMSLNKSKSEIDIIVYDNLNHMYIIVNNKLVNETKILDPLIVNERNSKVFIINRHELYNLICNIIENNVIRINNKTTITLFEKIDLNIYTTMPYEKCRVYYYYYNYSYSFIGGSLSLSFKYFKNYGRPVINKYNFSYIDNIIRYIYIIPYSYYDEYNNYICSIFDTVQFANQTVVIILYILVITICIIYLNQFIKSKNNDGMQNQEQLILILSIIIGILPLYFNDYVSTLVINTRILIVPYITFMTSSLLVMLFILLLYMNLSLIRNSNYSDIKHNFSSKIVDIFLYSLLYITLEFLFCSLFLFYISYTNKIFSSGIYIYLTFHNIFAVITFNAIMFSITLIVTVIFLFYFDKNINEFKLR